MDRVKLLHGEYCPYCGQKLDCEDYMEIIEKQQFVLDVIKDWAYSEQKASVGYTKARMAIQALIRGML